MAVARVLQAETVTAEAFAPFGDVLAYGLGAAKAANQGTATRADFAARFDNARGIWTPNLSVFRSKGLAWPVSLRLLERHPYSTQAFLPMTGDGFVVVVAPDAVDGAPDFDRARAFFFPPGAGVNYRRGLWHHPMLAIGRDADLCMVAWEDGTQGDCEEHPLPGPISVAAPD